MEEKFKNKNKSLENFTHGFDVVLLYMSISGKKRRFRVLWEGGKEVCNHVQLDGADLVLCSDCS